MFSNKSIDMPELPNSPNSQGTPNQRVVQSNSFQTHAFIPNGNNNSNLDEIYTEMRKGIEYVEQAGIFFNCLKISNEVKIFEKVAHSNSTEKIKSFFHHKSSNQSIKYEKIIVASDEKIELACDCKTNSSLINITDLEIQKKSSEDGYFKLKPEFQVKMKIEQIFSKMSDVILKNNGENYLSKKLKLEVMAFINDEKVIGIANLLELKLPSMDQNLAKRDVYTFERQCE